MSTLRSQRIAFATHSRHIATHTVRGDPRPLDEDRVTLAFGHGAIPKLIGQLSSPLLEVCLRSLFSLSTLLSKSENKVMAIKHGAVKALLALLGDTEPSVRENALVALGLIAVHANGKKAFAEEKAIPHIMEVLDDPEVPVRRCAYLCLFHQSSTPMGAKALLDAQAVPILIRNAAEPNVVEVQELALSSLYNCLQLEAAIDQALEYDTLQILKDIVVQHDNVSIQEKAISNIAALCFPLEAKVKARHTGCVPLLVSLLDHEDGALREASASALMAITIDDHAKDDAYRAGIVDHVAALLLDAFETVQLNACKCVSSMAHHVQARKRFHELNVSTVLNQFLDHENPLLRRNARVALTVLSGGR